MNNNRRNSSTTNGSQLRLNSNSPSRNKNPIAKYNLKSRQTRSSLKNRHKRQKTIEINKTTVSNVSQMLSLLSKDNCFVDFREGLQTLMQYLQNISHHPREAKYRKISNGNANFQIMFGHLFHSSKLLNSIGFSITEENDFYILPTQLYTSYEEQCILEEILHLCFHAQKSSDKQWRVIPRVCEDDNYVWSSIKHASEAHTIGRRPKMEDDHMLFDCFTGNKDMAFFATYDGHGGTRTVNFLVRAFYRNLEFYLSKNPRISVLKALEDCYHITDGQIRRSRIWQSGSTAVTCVLRKEGKKHMLYIANCGDTRAVLCRNGHALRVTKDHKPNDREEERLVKERGGVVAKFMGMKRVAGLAVTRSFGDHVIKPPISVQPTLTAIELDLDNDVFLVIACDGVWDVVSDEEIVQYLHAEMLSRTGAVSFPLMSKKECAKHLRCLCLDIVKNAYDRRSTDNISMIIVVF